jgi:hypothetical protein
LLAPLTTSGWVGGGFRPPSGRRELAVRRGFGGDSKFMPDS